MVYFITQSKKTYENNRLLFLLFFHCFVSKILREQQCFRGGKVVQGMAPPVVERRKPIFVEFPGGTSI